MAKKAKAERGMIRQTVIDLMRTNHVRAADQGGDKFEKLVGKVKTRFGQLRIKKDESGIRSVMNFVCRNPELLAGKPLARKGATKKSAKKSKSKKSAKANSRKGVAKKKTARKPAAKTTEVPATQAA